jgi:hypothetical protein
MKWSHNVFLWCNMKLERVWKRIKLQLDFNKWGDTEIYVKWVMWVVKWIKFTWYVRMNWVYFFIHWFKREKKEVFLPNNFVFGSCSFAHQFIPDTFWRIKTTLKYVHFSRLPFLHWNLAKNYEIPSLREKKNSLKLAKTAINIEILYVIDCIKDEDESHEGD